MMNSNSNSFLKLTSFLVVALGVTLSLAAAAGLDGTTARASSTLMSGAGARAAGQSQTIVKTSSGTFKITGGLKSEPEIVRISYLQGDVRFSRGDSKGPDLTKPWEQGVVNLPILQNYSLATGDGRTEIEFEYGSMLYLAENSVVIFDTLNTVNGVPDTDIELISGTATVAAHPIPNETFEVKTPTDSVSFHNPGIMRIDSYLDAIALTPQQPAGISVSQISVGATQASTGKTIAYRNGTPIQLGASDQSGAAADWDGWVAARVAQRGADIVAALKASGLPSFIPGLTDMYNGGTFFACPPFGICWE
ncbi:MAG TPA: FecR domain-containing protein, partial [Candidatus Limnocylindrales bacterium]|nr:FecR domain-containing protein [Candidatus Limnocylindrales bacterium]